MRRLSRLVALSGVAILLLAACGNNDTLEDVDVPSGDDAPIEDLEDTVPTPGDDAAPGQFVVQLGATALGDVLVDGEGMTLYLFTEDEAGVSNCTGACADIWPPLVIESELLVGAELDAALFSTITRTDGSTQVTVADMPLYLFANDSAPGDINGHGMNDVWFAVAADGSAVGAVGNETETNDASGNGSLPY